MVADSAYSKPLLAYPLAEKIFRVLALATIATAVVILVLLLTKMIVDGYPRLSPSFLTSPPSRFAEKAGIYSALVGTIYLMLLTAAVAFPIGVGAAVYLEEYAPRNRLTAIIEVNIANLAGVPSVIYGLIGLQVFVRLFNFERSILSGALTLALVILPVVIISAREAIRTVPRAYRDGALALGATKWQMVRSQVLPAALPGIMTGCILAFSRAVGETAPLVTMGALTYVAFVPDSLFSPFTALPIMAFNWVSRPQEAFHANAAGAIVVLLAILLLMNAAAIAIRIKFQRRHKD